MAQVRPADRAGTGDHQFTPALAKASASGRLVRGAWVARRRGDLRGVAATLVSGLVSAVVAAGVLFQPIHRPLRALGIFYFYRDPAGLDFTIAR